MLRDLQITIIGAGIAGLSAALALKQKGFASVRIFERAKSLSEVGAGLQLGPNAVRELNRLGLASKLEQISDSSMVGAIYAGEAGKKANKASYLGSLPLSAHSLVAYGQPCYQLLRSDLQQILHQAVLAEGVEIRLGTEVESVVFPEQLERISSDTNHANIILKDGTSCKTELVVIADGIGSKISARLFPDQELTYSGFACWRGLVERENLDGHWLDQVRVYTGEDRHLVVYPVANSTRLNLVATSKYPEWCLPERVRLSSREEWLQTYQGWSEEVKELISSVKTPMLWALYERDVLPKWHQQRAILLGDAAHPMLPSLAQGAAQAIEDAMELADILASSALEPQQLSSPEVLDKLLGQLYQRRCERVIRVQKSSRWNLNYFHQSAGIYRSIRNKAMKLAGPIASRLISSRYDWLYSDPGKSSRLGEK